MGKRKERIDFTQSPVVGMMSKELQSKIKGSSKLEFSSSKYTDKDTVENIRTKHTDKVYGYGNSILPTDTDNVNSDSIRNTETEHVTDISIGDTVANNGYSDSEQTNDTDIASENRMGNVFDGYGVKLFAPKQEVKSERFELLLTPTLKNKIKALAMEYNTSLNKLIHKVLEDFANAKK